MPLRFRAWLRCEFRRSYSAIAKTFTKTTKEAPVFHSSASRDHIVADDAPSAYDNQEILPFLHIGLSRNNEIRLLRSVNHVMAGVHVVLERRYDPTTAAAIAAAVRGGCISAGVTVSKAFLHKTVAELYDDVDVGCYQVAKAVIAATAAAPEENRMGVARSTAGSITLITYNNGKYIGDVPMTKAAGAQLASAAQGIAATISARILTGNLVFNDIPMPQLEEFLQDMKNVG